MSVWRTPVKFVSGSPIGVVEEKDFVIFFVVCCRDLGRRFPDDPRDAVVCREPLVGFERVPVSDRWICWITLLPPQKIDMCSLLLSGSL